MSHKAWSGGPAWHNIVICLALFIVAGATWLAPGVTRPYPGASIVLGGLGSIAAGLTYFSSRISSRGRVTLKAVLALLAWLALSTLLSVDGFRSQQTLAAWVGGVGVFFLISIAASNTARWTFLIHGLALNASALTWYGFSQMEKGGHLTSTFSNQDNFSVVPLTAIFLLLTQTKNTNRNERMLASIQIVLLGLGLLRTTSRAAVFGVLVGMLGMALAGSLQRKNSKKSRAPKPSPVPKLLGAVVALALVSGLLTPVLGRIGEIGSGADSQGVTMRVDVLVHGLKASMARPLNGFGPGTFALAYQRYRPESILPEYIFVNVAHNDYVEAALEFGWVGFLLAGATCCLSLLRGVRLIRSDTKSWEAQCCIGCMAALSGYSLLNFAIPVPALLFLEFACLGVLNTIPTGSSPDSKARMETALYSCILALGGVWATYQGVISLRVNTLVQDSQRLVQALRWEEALPKLSSAVALAPSSTNLLVLRGNLEATMASYKKSSDLQSAAERDLTRAVKVSPYDGRASNSLLRFYRTGQQFAKAEEASALERKNRPYAPGSLRELAQLQLLQKKYPQAADTLVSSSLSEAEVRTTLVPLLIALEEQRPNQATELLSSWTGEGGRQPLVESLLRPLAEAAINQRKLDVAARFLRMAGQLNPQDLEIRHLESRLLLKQHKKKEALAILSQLIKSESSTSAQARVIDRALSDWVRLQPGFPDAPELAFALETRIKQRSRAASNRLILSEMLLRQKKVDQAAEVITRGLDQEPENPELLARMGTCMLRQGLNDLAVTYFDQALKIDPTLVEARAGKKGQTFRFTDL